MRAPTPDLLVVYEYQSKSNDLKVNRKIKHVQKVGEIYLNGL